MKLAARTHITNRIELDLVPDELDSMPLVRTLWFEGAGIDQIGNTRRSLLAYLATRHLVSNLLEVEGFLFPSFLAASCMRDFPGDEFFVHGISNTPEKIVIDRKVDRIEVGSNESSLPSSDGVRLVPDVLGYRLVWSDGTSALVSSNIDLHFSGVEFAPLLASLGAVVAVCETVGVASIEVSCCPVGFPDEEATRLKRLFADAGLMLCLSLAGDGK